VRIRICAGGCNAEDLAQRQERLGNYFLPAPLITWENTEYTEKGHIKFPYFPWFHLKSQVLKKHLQKIQSVEFFIRAYPWMVMHRFCVLN
jgi:hypothetical protein